MPFKPRAEVVQPLDTSYRFITLTQGQIAIVDADDYPRLSGFNWRAMPRRTGFSGYYAVRLITMEGKRIAILMHRFVCDSPKSLQIDHINGNGLDNRRENLRICTCAQNQWNKAAQKNNTTGFKGVSRHTSGWTAQITFNGKRIHIGKFLTPNLASVAYETKARELYGQFYYPSPLIERLPCD